jgi:ankyrin repeat protein
MFSARTQATNTQNTTTASINAKSQSGWASLHLAAAEGQVSTVRLLIEKKADVSLENDEGWSPMHLAAANGHIPVVDLLLRANADIMNRDNEGRTALHRAAWYGRPAMIEHLVSRKAQLEAGDSKSKTALHSAAASKTTMSMTVIRTLVKAGAELEARTDLYWTPLHTAVRYSDEEVVGALLDLNADKEARNNYDETPLLLACNEVKIDARSRYPVVRTLLQRKANIHARDNGGLTSLHWASSRGDLPLVRMLVTAKADTTILCNKKMAPLHYASKYGHDDVVTFLLAQQPSSAPATSAAGSRQHPVAATAATAAATVPAVQPVASARGGTNAEDSSTANAIQELQEQLQSLATLVLHQNKVIAALKAEQADMREQIQQLQANQQKAAVTHGGGAVPAATDFFTKADRSRIVTVATIAGATTSPTSAAARAAPSHSSINRPAVGQ